MRLVDSHGHLNADRFDGDVELVVGGARLAGLERLMVPGWNERSSARALELVSRWPWLDAAVGVHPHDAAKVDGDGWRRITAWARDDRVLAIGETGLDADRLFSPWADQLDNLRRNLALALETGKPAILHCRSKAGERDAQDALVEELRAAGFEGAARREAFGERPPAVIHSFSGPVDYADTVVAMGLAVSFSGLVFRRGEEASAEAVTRVPAGRMLVETDAPFLTPPGGPRGRNEPSAVAITARWAAERRGVGEDELGDGLVAAYDATFHREDRPA
jgi:TatD DNase family protein